MTSTKLNTRAWLKKHEIFDNDLCNVLNDDKFNIKYPEEDFVNFTLKNWKDFEIAIDNALNKENQNQSRKNRFKKTKLQPLKKLWQDISGNKNEIGTKQGNTKTQGNTNKSLKSNEEQDNLMQKGAALKKWMMSKQCFAPELLFELVLEGVTTKDELAKINSIEQIEEIERKARLRRQPQQREGLNKTLVKFRSVWKEETGYKPTMQNKKQKSKSKSKSKTSNGNDGAPELKKWLKENKIFSTELLAELIAAKITTVDELNKIDSSYKLKELRRKTLERRQPKLRPKLKILFDKFEKLFIELTGFSSNMQTKKTKKTAKKKNREEQKEDTPELKDWLKKNKIFSTELLAELIEAKITTVDGLNKIDSSYKLKELRRKTLERRQPKLRPKLKILFDKFEKLFIELTGFSSDMQTKKTKKAPKKKEKESEGSAIRKWLKNKEVLIPELVDELVRRDVSNPKDLKKIDSNTKCQEIVVQVVQSIKSRGVKDTSGVEAKLNKFEKVWREYTGVPKDGSHKKDKYKTKKN